MTEIVDDWPPNIAAIREVLPVTRNNIFAYDGVIYSPSGTRLEAALIAHEQVHFAQQASYAGGVVQWWRDFLASPKFRLSQELPAHRVEWAEFLKTNPPRKHKRLRIKHMAKRLSGKMYGCMISAAEAKRLIQK